jgi:hypothetical protein
MDKAVFEIIAILCLVAPLKVLMGLEVKFQFFTRSLTCYREAVECGIGLKSVKIFCASEAGGAQVFASKSQMKSSFI